MTSTDATVLDERTIETTVTGQGFRQSTRPYTLHFVTRFDRPFSTTGTWAGETLARGSTHTSSSVGLGLTRKRYAGSYGACRRC